MIKIKSLFKCLVDYKPISHVTMNDVLNELRSINIRKTTGCDLIPGKLIKEGADFLCKPIQSLLNKCIDTCTFPNALKLADVVPIFKKNDMFNKINIALRMYFDDIFSQYLSGYRASYGCQDVLSHFINNNNIIIRIFIHTRSTQILITTVYTQLDNTDAKIIK